MTRTEMNAKVEAYKTETHDALQIVWDATNKGQRNKLLRNEEVKAILDRYGVNYETP